MMDAKEEFKRLERTREIIRKIIREKGRENLYDLTGIAGGFEVSSEDICILETYVGPALFSEKLNKLGIQHLNGNLKVHKAVGFNRTSSAILATIMALSSYLNKVVHYVPEKPSHPSIPKSCKIFSLEYFESDCLDEILERIDNKTLTIITGATMDHKIVDLGAAKEIIHHSKENGSIIFMDDASGARLRLLYNQPSALELGADLAVTSTDKLMNGPRAGLLGGRKDLIDKIYPIGLKYGLEAQAPILAAMVNAIGSFKLDNLKRAFERAKKIDLSLLEDLGSAYERTPTGFAIKKVADDEKENIEKLVEIGFNLLEDYNIITITVAGMPGASKSLRIDLTAPDAERLSDKEIVDAVVNSIKKVIKK